MFLIFIRVRNSKRLSVLTMNLRMNRDKSFMIRYIRCIILVSGFIISCLPVVSKLTSFETKFIDEGKDTPYLCLRLIFD